MVAFTYRCPRNGLQVQGWTAADQLTDGEFYEPVTCIACGRVHLSTRSPVRCWRTQNGDNGELVADRVTCRAEPFTHRDEIMAAP